ncbi:MAG: Zn-dependent oligopeptidase [Planctomycetota bacterium]|nr:Zn-dependent oligopeptidase [Planctomycetota bacterium]
MCKRTGPKRFTINWFAASVVALSLSAGAAVDPDSPVADALARADLAVERIVSVANEQRSFDNTVEAIDDLIAQLELDTNMTMFLAYVSTDPDERLAGEKAEEDFRNWLIELLKREDLYGAVKAYAQTNPNLSPEQTRLLKFTMRDFRRAGMNLSVQDRHKLTEVEKDITRLSIEFEKNIRAEETVVPLTRGELSGLPEEFFDNPSLKQSGDIYLVGMSYPQFLPILDYCDNETTRKKVWLSYKRRGGRRNVGVLEHILKLRAEAAQLLTYAHPADFEIEVKMAKNADVVRAFYDRLRPLVREKALQDAAQLTAAKREHTGDPNAKLSPWDSSFYLNYLKKTKYAVDPEKVREYLPLDRVIDGLFSITQSLYGLEYREVTEHAVSEGRAIWHENVRLFEVWDKVTGEMLGEFYVDLHPRENKYGHAAQWGLAQHKVWSDGTVTKPVAALVCNFSEPTPQRPSLLTHDEVETFFHEFGHCLHTILSESRYFRFAGTGVERDFVEAPSQMFENWVWDADVLKTFARHYETGEPFPQDLLDGMIKARHLGSGMLAEHQFYYGLVDLAYHTDPDGEVDTTKIQAELFGEVELYEEVPQTYFQAAFGHLTGYQAGYYGYQWSLVYACDMFGRFKELGLLDPEAGLYYRRTILARGGAMDGLDLVREYLGREPRMDAYLAHLGLSR